MFTKAYIVNPFVITSRFYYKSNLNILTYSATVLISQYCQFPSFLIDFTLRNIGQKCWSTLLPSDYDAILIEPKGPLAQHRTGARFIIAKNNIIFILPKSRGV